MCCNILGTTWDVWNPINNGKNYLSTGASDILQSMSHLATKKPRFGWTNQTSIPPRSDYSRSRRSARDPMFMGPGWDVVCFMFPFVPGDRGIGDYTTFCYSGIILIKPLCIKIPINQPGWWNGITRFADFCFLYLGTTPHPVTVTTRIITFLIGNPYKPSFVTVTGWGVDLTCTIFTETKRSHAATVDGVSSWISDNIGGETSHQVLS